MGVILGVFPGWPENSAECPKKPGAAPVSQAQNAGLGKKAGKPALLRTILHKIPPLRRHTAGGAARLARPQVGLLDKLLNGTVELVNSGAVAVLHRIRDAVLQMVLEDDLARVVDRAADCRQLDEDL